MTIPLSTVFRNVILFPHFFFNDTATTEIYTLSLHDALPISYRPPNSRPTSGSTIAARPPRRPLHADVVECYRSSGSCLRRRSMPSTRTTATTSAATKQNDATPWTQPHGGGTVGAAATTPVPTRSPVSRTARTVSAREARSLAAGTPACALVGRADPAVGAWSDGR